MKNEQQLYDHINYNIRLHYKPGARAVGAVRGPIASCPATTGPIGCRTGAASLRVLPPTPPPPRGGGGVLFLSKTI